MKKLKRAGLSKKEKSILDRAAFGECFVWGSPEHLILWDILVKLVVVK